MTVLYNFLRWFYDIVFTIQNYNNREKLLNIFTIFNNWPQKWNNYLRQLYSVNAQCFTCTSVS